MTKPIEADRKRLLEMLLRRESVAAPKAERPLADRDQDLPLSFAQQRLWVMQQFVPNHPVYNAPLAFRLRGELDVPALEAALTRVVRRHESLRTSFPAGAEGPRQHIAEPYQISLPVIEVSSFAEATRLVQESAVLPFDLENGPLLRAELFRIAEQDHVFLVTLHHIVTDGWSLSLLFDELGSCYRADPVLPELTVQYADYAWRQRAELTGDKLANDLEYWRDQLSGAPAELTFPIDRPRPTEPSYAGAVHPFTISGPTTRALRALAEAQGVTLYMVLLTAFQVLLARYTGESDVVVGSPIANRRGPELEALIGFFVNMLVLRTDFADDPGFTEALASVRQTALGAYDHQDMPFERLVAALRPDRQLSMQPLFQTQFQLYQQHERVQDGPLNLAGLSVEALPADTVTSKFDLSVLLFEEGEQLSGRIEYATDLYDAGTIASLTDSFQTLLASVLADPTAPISELNILSAAEAELVLHTWNDTATDLPTDTTLAHQLIKQASPTAIALVSGEERLTYAELDAASNRLAHRLRELGVGAGVRVGLCFERGVPLVVGLVAVLKAGGAYVPLDPAYPAERLAFLVADAEIGTVLTVTALADRLPQATVLSLDVEDISAFPSTPPEPVAGPDDPAYVIYTSGSTGQPNGVVNNHRGVLNRLIWMQRQYEVDSADVILQKTPYSFDVSVWEFLLPLLTGARLVLARPDGHRDPAYLAELIRAESVTTTHFVPSMLRVFLDEIDVASCTSLRRVFCSGEALSADLARRFLGSGTTSGLYNLYGPTEAAIDVTHWTCRAAEPGPGVPIGRPVANTKMYVLDQHGRPTPSSVAGELHISGVQLAQGYANRPELTARRFVTNPYATPGYERMYRTGDLARWTADGVIEFLGRLDHQVKVNGFRVEPGEIEAHLTEHPSVGQAVVLARGDTPDAARLIAYVVAHETGSVADEQTDNWRSVFDHSYLDKARDAEHNFAGWNSSYTGEAIDEALMADWVRASTDRIAALAPNRVLELGVGTGLLLFRLAPSVQRYVGLDVSGEAIELLRAATEHLPQVRLARKEADDLSGLDGELFDTIVINSVVQYFPDADYLLTVLRNAMTHLAPGGAVYLGDVRSLPLLAAQHASIELFRSAEDTPASEVLRRVRRAVATEHELVVDPRFFTQLPVLLPEVSTADVAPRAGTGETEMARFRYDVVLRKAPVTRLAPPEQALDWDQVELAAVLAREPEPFVLRGVPNARTATAAATDALLRTSDCPATAAEIRARIEHTEGIDPEELRALTEKHGHHVTVSWSGAATDGRFDAFFNAAPPIEVGAPTPIIELTNDPLRARRSNRLGEVLRSHLAATLPEHLVPAAFVVLPELPLTPNGKLNRSALPDPYLQLAGNPADGVAPRTPQEEALARIWSQVLSLSRIGVHDNFFTLGGDSIQGIQVVTLARDAGLRITLRMIFLHPTVAELASVANSVVAVEPEQGNVIGSVPLSPIQHWLLAQGDVETRPVVQYITIRLAEHVDLNLVERALGAVVEHHDALRLRLHQTDSGWRQHVAPPVDRIPVEPVADLESLHRGLDPVHGPMLRAGRIATGELVLSAHHLCVDAVSWSVLLADFDSAYTQLAAGERAPKLPAKTLSVRQWGQLLESMTRDAERDYWTDVVRPTEHALPTDGHGGPGRYRDARTTVGRLSKQDTAALLDDVPASYRTRITEVLLCALARTCAEWGGGAELVVDLEGHGRDVVEEADVSRTVGWFTTLYPVRLSGVGGFGDALVAAKETLRAVPGSGIGYGLLRHLAKEIEASPAEIIFNYLGRAEPATPTAPSPRVGRYNLAGWADPERTRSHLLEIDALIADDCFEINTTWHPGAHRAETIDRFTDLFLRVLREIIVHCAEVGANHVSPADFPLAGLSMAAVNEYFADPDIVDVYPLTPAQDGILFLTRAATEPGMYLEQALWTVSELDIKAYRAAWQQVVDEYPVLRTRIELAADERPLQVVHEHATPRIERIALDTNTPDLDELLAQDRARGMDLTTAPLLRLTVFDTPDGRVRVLFTCHHLILDGWSAARVLAEVLRRYAALRRGEQVRTEPSRPFRDFVGAILNADHTEDERFWRDYLAGVESTPVPLPAPQKPETGWGAVETRLGKQFGADLAAFAGRNQVTASTVLTAAWGLLVGWYLGRDDVVAATAESGRDLLPGMERMVGMFVNTVPVRVRSPKSARVGEWLRGLQREHTLRPHHTPLTTVQGLAGLPQGSALFDTLIAVENYPMDDAVRDTLTGTDDDIRVEDRDGYPLTVAAEFGADPLLRLVFDRSRFAAPAVERLLTRLVRALTELMTDPDRRLDELTLAEPAAPTTRPEHRTAPYVPDAIIAQALANPNEPAVVQGTTTLSYSALNSASARLSRRLRALGAGPNTAIAVCLRPGPELIVALLAVLRAGAGYLPLDPNQPVERLRGLVADADARIGISAPDLRPDVDTHWISLDGPDAPESTVDILPEGLAYLLFTSGSTGRPKGVAVSHAAIAGHLAVMVDELGLEQGDRVLALSPATFDISVEQMFAPLLAGATVVFSDGPQWSPRDFLDNAARYRIGFANLTAPYWHQVVEELALGLPTPEHLSLKGLLLGADAVQPEMVHQWRQHVPGDIRLLVGYGLTETVITSTLYAVPGEVPQPLPVGPAIRNRDLYVVDRFGRPAPVDVRGEIHLGGPALALGYVGAPALTADRFVPDWLGGEPGARLYRTGDAGMLDAEGRVIVLGRMDEQLKVRGLRIEPGEIEAVLGSHPAIGAASVLPAPGGERLVAFVTPGSTIPPGPDQLREFARSTLPAQLVPDLVITVPGLPLTSHGKVDKAALRRLIPEATRSRGSKPVGWLPELVAECWGEVLGRPEIYVEDNFFDLGGHSLRATRVASRLRRALNLDVPLRLVMERPRFDEFCLALEDLLTESADADELDRLLAEVENL
jgi:amino acid adenylation domain-containing protein/non-ribosomal peptide synthase protein (TIGR01720 family)